jgi:ubiquinone/menaquinone biosynthesis C-methylase UbiE
MLAEVEFDRIADVYDETRRALDKVTLKGIREMLTKHSCHSILEIGIGTGRVSLPLIGSGYDVTGADVSRRMMEKAKGKGVTNLFLADGGRTPFKEKSFDATLMAHVFHLLEDPMVVLREAARVSRIGVFALIRKSTDNRPWFPFYWGGSPPPTGSGDGMDEAATKFFEERRERFRKIAEKYHWSWDPSRRFHNWRREHEILETYPPDDLKVVSDVVVNETLEDRIARFQKGAYGFMSEMPAEMREEIIKDMRASASSLPQGARRPRHEVYQLAVWCSDSLSPPA